MECWLRTKLQFRGPQPGMVLFPVGHLAESEKSFILHNLRVATGNSWVEAMVASDL